MPPPLVQLNARHASLANAVPTIWTMGHRNPQGLTTPPRHAVWASEHGPKGGDELNLIQRGANYGEVTLSLGWRVHSPLQHEAPSRRQR